MRLSELKLKQQATITQIHQHHTEAGKDAIASRLSSLGFVPGEAIEIETKGLFGGEPILVKIGFTRFALRLNEAERIEVEI